jgi:hypothetical protein
MKYATIFMIAVFTLTITSQSQLKTRPAEDTENTLLRTTISGIAEEFGNKLELL